TWRTGTCGSARPGDVGEFRDLHAFAAGDRLRRIDWKGTARRAQGLGDLYVRGTDATSDATVIVVVDSREDVGERVERWSGAPSDEDGLRVMDVAREAAASLAAAAIAAGDRVGLLDIAAHHGVVRAGIGKRHLDRLLRRIALSEPSGTPLNRRRAPIVPAGAIVYLVSALLDDEATSVAVLWRAAGHRVIAVDVLPALQLDGCESHSRLAHRLVMAERQLRLTRMRANGAELFRWQEDAEQPSRAVVLRSPARRVGSRHWRAAASPAALAPPCRTSGRASPRHPCGCGSWPSVRRCACSCSRLQRWWQSDCCSPCLGQSHPTTCPRGGCCFCWV